MASRADDSAVVGVVVGAAAEVVRRSVGPTAWCVLEVLVTSPSTGDGGARIVRSSVRELATRIGVSKNTAQRALVTLRRAGLVRLGQQRDVGGRFGDSSYRLSIPDDVLICWATLDAPSPRRRARRLRGRSAALAPPVGGFGEQLVLLPGD
jgi:DNA-binding transcriptional ArsR family regulator